MRLFIFKIILSLSLHISKLGLALNLPILSSFSFLISLRKLKSHKTQHEKIVLILEKSHGIDDIKQIVKENSNKKIQFLVLSRIHLRIIHDYFSRLDQHNLYKKYINEVFSFFKKFKNIKLIISFNLNYKAERIIQKLYKKNNIKHIVLHKESLFSKDVLKLYKKKFKKYGLFAGDHICVYNDKFKKLLISSKVANTNNITSIGMPRLDNFFQCKNIKSNQIVFFLIRPLSGLDNIKNFTWHNLANEVLDCVLNFAEKNPKLRFIFKVKIIDDPETIEQQNRIIRKGLKNCNIVYGGNPENLILSSKFIIAFNSTSIFEALAARKKVIIPCYKKYEKEIKKYTINFIKSKNIFNPRNNNELIEKISDLNRSKKNKNKTITLCDKKLLMSYVGNSDGKSSKRLFNIIEKVTDNLPH